MYRIIFLGSPDFAIPSLETLVEDPRFDVVGVFSQPDKKVGRKQILTPSDVKKRALELNLNVYTPEKINTPENVELIKSLNPDFLFTAAYGKIISPEILAIPQIEAINLHGSLLPKYRGASPIQSSLLNGDKETGVTYIRMVEKMDAGKMFYKTKIQIEKEDNAATLFEKIAELGRKHTPDVLAKIANGELKEVKQNEEEVSYCKKISKANGEIDWEKETAEEIYNKIRAYTPWPGCFTTFQGKILKIIKADFNKIEKSPLRGLGGVKTQVEQGFPTTPVSSAVADYQNFRQNDAINNKNGTVFQKNFTTQITTKSGNLIPQIIQLEGKKAMSIEDFIKGKPEFVGATLG